MIKKISIFSIVSTTYLFGAGTLFVSEGSLDKALVKKGDAYCMEVPIDKIKEIIAKNGCIDESSEIKKHSNKLLKFNCAYKGGRLDLFVTEARTENQCDRMNKKMLLALNPNASSVSTTAQVTSNDIAPNVSMSSKVTFNDCQAFKGKTNSLCNSFSWNSGEVNQLRQLFCIGYGSSVCFEDKDKEETARFFRSYPKVYKNALDMLNTSTDSYAKSVKSNLEAFAQAYGITTDGRAPKPKDGAISGRDIGPNLDISQAVCAKAGGSWDLGTKSCAPNTNQAQGKKAQCKNAGGEWKWIDSAWGCTKPIDMSDKPQKLDLAQMQKMYAEKEKLFALRKTTYKEVMENKKCLSRFLSQNGKDTWNGCKDIKYYNNLVVAFGDAREWSELSSLEEVCKTMDSVRYGTGCKQRSEYNSLTSFVMKSYNREKHQKWRYEHDIPVVPATAQDIKKLDATKPNVTTEDMKNLLQYYTLTHNKDLFVYGPFKVWLELKYDENTKEQIVTIDSMNGLTGEKIIIPINAIKAIHQNGILHFNKKIHVDRYVHNFSVKEAVKLRPIDVDVTTYDLEVDGSLAMWQQKNVLEALNKIKYLVDSGKFKGNAVWKAYH